MTRARRSLRFLSLAFPLLLVAELSLDSAQASASAALDGRTRTIHPARTGRDAGSSAPAAFGRQTPLLFPPDETFGGVIPPELPPGWINDHTGDGPGWITVNDVVSSPPNAGFTDDTATASDKSLETPPFNVVANGRVAFNHKLDLESSTDGLAYDGVVLEIAYDQNPFADIVDVGGTFVSGGYNYTIQGSINPLFGRAAWSGTSPEYLGVVVDLPPSANGRTVRLRWRVGTDLNTGRSGYWLDDIHVDVNGAAGDDIFADSFECLPCEP